jgi:alpha/beta hydrolase fold
MCIFAKLSINDLLCRFLLFGTIATLLGCTAPEVRFLQEAEGYGFEQNIVQGTAFKHVVYLNKLLASNVDAVHIYLDGDGSAWIAQRWASANPTPRNTLILRLMKQDNATSLYLGRPCYHGFSQTFPCNAKLWTSHRYSPTVINSMVAAINNLINEYKSRPIILIGYSGGGTLALLLAEHFPNIAGIITIAANLDINAWTDYHGYSTLFGSLNPAQKKPLQNRIFQLHLAGGRDSNIPVSQIKSFVTRQSSAQLLIFDDYDHHCCWEEIWPSILESIKTYDK